ncbi:RNA polymerase sigma factor [Aeromicrobium piscarium]|uniref:RNA polymerase sigma factor n=1 Tax=Aeromicrobium piscarium TaxID=2590901 RepID=UPI001C8F6C22|nr:sigma factor [Aeromicrobium piscarium]
MDDASLVRAAVLGDDAAFAAIVDRHGPSMFRFARRMLADDDDAGEAVQDAFISAWKNIESFQGLSCAPHLAVQLDPPARGRYPTTPASDAHRRRDPGGAYR